MTDKQLPKIFAQFADHEKRICALEGNPQKNQEAVPSVNKQKANSKNKNEDLFPPIQKLLKDRFFKEWQTDLDVCNALTIRLLTKKKPLRASVVNVLRAMVKKGLLVRDRVQKNKRLVFAYKQP